MLRYWKMKNNVDYKRKMRVKVEIQMRNQENDLDNDSLLDLQKRFVKTLKKSLR